MKSSTPHFRVAAALALATGLIIGCQDLLSPGKAADGNSPTADESGSLSLSIKNDSTCRGSWHAILAARAAGHADNVSEAAFLASCVTEAKPEKPGTMPPVPPALVPDSGTRCKWIVSQIEGGRDTLTVSYRKYCPDDCRKLEASDSASHEKLCRDPEPHPVIPPREHDGDSLPPVGHGGDSLPPKEHGGDSLPPAGHGGDSLPPPPHGDDTCALLHAKLEVVKPGQTGRAELEHAFAARCKDTVPPSLPPPPTHDSVVVPPPNPTGHDSVCADLKLRLGESLPGTSGRSELEAAFKAHCAQTLPPPPLTDCDALRLKLVALDPASADYVHLAGSIREHCPETPAK